MLPRFKIHEILLFALVAVLFELALPSCAGIAHMAGLSTTDDLQAQAKDESAARLKQAEDTADMHDGKISSAEMVNRTAAVGEKFVQRVYERTAPPPTQAPTAPTDWPGIVALVVGAVATTIGTIAHSKSTANQKSLAETDDWVHEVDKSKVDKPSAS